MKADAAPLLIKSRIEKDGLGPVSAKVLANRGYRARSGSPCLADRMYGLLERLLAENAHLSVVNERQAAVIRYHNQGSNSQSE